MSRHKCTNCGKVREEKFMSKSMSGGIYGTPEQITTRYGHGIWYCTTNPDCFDNRFRGRY